MSNPTTSSFFRWCGRNAVFLLLGACLISSFFIRSHYLINWDAGQFALGTVHYSLVDHQPHPPGYFLFVKVGGFLSYFLHDVNLAFILLALVAALGAAYFIYRAVVQLFDSKALGVVMGLLFLINPIVWYYRSTALTYTFEALAAAFLISITIDAFRGKEVLPLSVASIALLAGFRPSVVLIAAPFLCVQFFFSKKKFRALGLSFLLGSAALLVWFIPFTYAVGGGRSVYHLIRDQFSATSGDWSYKVRQMKVFFETAFYACNGLLLLVVLYPKKIGAFLKSREGFLLCVVPLALMMPFYVLVNFGEAGYFLSLLPIIFIVAAAAIKYASWRYIVPVLAAFQLLLFFGPTLTWLDQKVSLINYSSITSNDRRIGSYLATVRSHEPSTILLAAYRGEYLTPGGTLAHYPDTIRTLQYYLPEYMIYDLVGVRNTYFETVNYTHTMKTESKTLFPSSNETLVILVDYLAPDVQPKGLPLASSFSQPTGGNIYTANIKDVSAFGLGGVSFQRAR